MLGEGGGDVGHERMAHSGAGTVREHVEAARLVGAKQEAGVSVEVDLHAHMISSRPMHRGIALVLVASACHVTVTTDTRRPGVIERIPRPERAMPRPPTIVLTDLGTLRFVEPLDCPTDEIMNVVTGIEIETRPNLATFVIGVIATSAGAILTARYGVAGETDNAFFYTGLISLGVGLPLAIGPWVGTSKELRAGPDAPPVLQPGPNVECGSRALVATSATLAVRGVEVHGTIDRDGVFSVSPYQLVDAYDTRQVPAWDIAAIVDTRSGPQKIAVVLEGGALTKHAQAFLASATFDAKVEPMRLVPNVVAGTPRVALTTTSDGPALRVVLPVKNDGPGETWGLRGQITSTTKAVDGRVMYIGHVAKGAAIARELLIPLTATAADSIKGSTIDLSIELRDAHGTAPQTPVRFHGSVLGDAPR